MAATVLVGSEFRKPVFTLGKSSFQVPASLVPVSSLFLKSWYFVDKSL